jgi:transposase
MLFVRPPTHEELIELKRMTRQEIGRVSQRAQMILLSHQHCAVPAIAKLFVINAKTVRYWIKRFNQHGPAGLYDEPRSGRPRKLNRVVAERLSQLVANDPQQAGYVATFWTVAMLVVSLFQQLGVVLHPTSVRIALHEMGLRWGRPRLSMPLKVDPEKAAKQWAIVQAVLTAGPTAVVLYADESRVHLLPILRALWHRVGEQLRIPTPGSNVTRALFGALNIDSGQWVYLVRERMKAEDFIVFLEHLLAVYVDVPIVLIVDNYSIHTAGLVKAWLAQHPRLQLHYLPKYCSHLNPVEAIWLRLKNKIAADRLYGSIKCLLEAVAVFFSEMTPSQARVWAAV